MCLWKMDPPGESVTENTDGLVHCSNPTIFSIALQLGVKLL